jgi:hypothetical protein
MDQSLSITPPPELVSKWCYEDGEEIKSSPRWFFSVCAKAAKYGADQELEAICEWLHWQNLATHSELIPSLRAARRPKPPSLKEQALAVLEEEPEDAKELIVFDTDQVKIIRRALEALDD